MATKYAPSTPVSGVGWILGIVVGILVLSLVPNKNKWVVVVWLSLAGLAFFANNKRRGPLESFADLSNPSRFAG